VTSGKGGKKATCRGSGDTAAAGHGAKQSVARGGKIPDAGRGKKRVEKTADGHHVLIDGRRWRATDPGIPEERRQQLVNELMRARRDVGRALRAGDAEAEREARARVHECKVGLGERGEKWWEEEEKG
jgi:hypothetical protein